MDELIRKKKIIFLINDITALGGTERMCTLIANELVNTDFDVTIISHFESKSNPFFALNSEVKRQQLLQAMKTKKDHFTLPFRIYKCVNTLKPDMIISCDTQMCLYSSIVLINHKHIAWEHFNSSIFTRFGSRWFGRRLASLLCKKIIVLTQSDKAHWIKTLQTKSSKLTVIPNPSPVQARAIIEKKNQENIVLAVGRMTEQKGFDMLIRAFAEINQESKSNWKLRIVGPTGSAKPELQKLISIFDLDAQIELICESSEIEQEYQRASIYVMSSRYEGFGLTLLEAMGQGLPVIAFDCPMGPAEILDGRYGALLPPENIEQLSLTIERFMLKPELRNKYAKLAYEGSKKYATPNIVHLWQSTLNQV